jgi:hypothetical protein
MDDRLKIYALVTKSHEPMLNDWFLKTMPADCRPIINFMHAEPAEFRKGQWHKIFAQKIEMILETLGSNDIIVVSDVDIQFFKPIAEDIRSRMQDKDILFQNNLCGRSTAVVGLCAGFIALRCSDAVRPFFEKALQDVNDLNDPRIDDQVVYAGILKYFPNLRFGLLPDNYWTRAELWVPDNDLKPPSDIVIHHANWVLGIEHKLEQLKRVRSAVQALPHSWYIPRFQA